MLSLSANSSLKNKKIYYLCHLLTSNWGEKTRSGISTCQNNTLQHDSYKLPVHELRSLLTTKNIYIIGSVYTIMQLTTQPLHIFFLLIYRWIIKLLRWTTFLICNLSWHTCIYVWISTFKPNYYTYLLHTTLHLFNNIKVPPCLHTEINWQIFLRMQIGAPAQGGGS